jgi:hypothetical protein
MVGDRGQDGLLVKAHHGVSGVVSESDGRGAAPALNSMRSLNSLRRGRTVRAAAEQHGDCSNIQRIAPRG